MFLGWIKKKNSDHYNYHGNQTLTQFKLYDIYKLVINN